MEVGRVDMGNRVRIRCSDDDRERDALSGLLLGTAMVSRIRGPDGREVSLGEAFEMTPFADGDGFGFDMLPRPGFVDGLSRRLAGRGRDEADVRDFVVSDISGKAMRMVSERVVPSFLGKMRLVSVGSAVTSSRTVLRL